MNNQTVGYIRISAQGQNTARQLAGLTLDKEFVDIMSGISKDRKGLNDCIAYVRDGDTVVVDSIDRLARNLLELQEIINEILNKGVSIKFLKENLIFNATKDPVAILTLQMMGAFAEFERTMIKSRQRDGIDAAKKSGKHLGRPKMIDSKFVSTVKDKISNSQSIRSIAKDMKVSRATIYKAISL